MVHTFPKDLLLVGLAIFTILYAVECNTIVLRASHGKSTYKTLPRRSYSKSTVELTKYPNKRTIERAQLERFEEYYKCLNEFTMSPVAHYVLPGTSVSLHCDACISPQESSMQWEYGNKATNFTKIILIPESTVNKHSRTLRSTQTEDGTVLNLYGLSMEESGHYNCLQDGNVVTPHLVQVANLTETLLQVYPTTALKRPYPSTSFNLTEQGVRIWYEWNDWTNCSRCDQAGERMRIGICMVTLFRDNNSTDATTLKIFRKGIPCRSNFLPTLVKNHPKILSAKNEYMMEFCQETCHKAKKYILSDTGKVLLNKIANLSDSFTLIKRLPHVSPPIQHSTLYLNQWETANVQCPGGDYNSAIAHWRLGLKLILSENERVSLGPTGILFIKNLVIADSNIYSCWQRNRLVGIVKLTVSQPIRLSFEEQLNTVVLIAIITSFLIITLRILRAYLKRRRVAKKIKKTG